jgi:alpha/beta superfamily hydrolase
LLGEGGALLLRAHDTPLWSTTPAILHHGSVRAQSFSFTTADGVTLEAERATPDAASRASIVLCHPHPQFGGTMRSIVISALFEALPAAGFTVVRFNFRGVERSGGAHDHGRSELLDVHAAVEAGADSRLGHKPLVLAGWSFGADMTLATPDARLAGWIAIAPPLRFRADVDAVAHDERPKLVVLGQHDEYRDPTTVVEATESWRATEVEVIPGASHYFVGRTDRVVETARAFVERLVES